ncbi:hypothetical protein OG741_00440 [Streptomyces sp. NBC_01410]|uniref:hypothetical protein n=1 Tax=Streptomyces sp. NBC_01410 TaxID=2903856 RepID=UPI00324EF006
MRNLTKQIAIGISTATLCFGATAGTAAAAPNGSVTPLYWNGNCYPISYTSGSFTGWCDGTGPQNYGTYVDCSNGYRYNSTYVRWYGDRRGVTSYCPSGTIRVGQGYRLF